MFPLSSLCWVFIINRCRILSSVFFFCINWDDFYIVILLFILIFMFLFLREIECEWGRGSERETGSEVGSRLWAVSAEPDMGLELTDCEIMTWAKGTPTNWAIQAPLFVLLMWYIMLVDLGILNHFYIPGINPTWLWWMILISCIVECSLLILCWGFLHLCSSWILAYGFLLCGIFVCFC